MSNKTPVIVIKITSTCTTSDGERFTDKVKAVQHEREIGLRTDINNFLDREAGKDLSDSDLRFLSGFIIRNREMLRKILMYWEECQILVEE